jgi:hypothetical protein
MLTNLPQQYRKDPWILALVGAIQGRMESQEARASTITAQESLDTVTWNLEVEERLLGITPDADATLDDRRTALKARWRSGGKITIEQIQAVADAWKDGEVAVSFPNGRIRVRFVGRNGVPADMPSLQAAIRLVVPAHLQIEYAYANLLIRDIHEAMSLTLLQQQLIENFAF